MNRIYVVSLIGVAFWSVACGSDRNTGTYRDDSRREDSGDTPDGILDSSVTPEDAESPDREDTNPPPSTLPGSIRGTVWAPGNAPGMVPPRHEIPVSGALVSLARNMPAPIPSGVYCEECTQGAFGSVITDHQGRFVLNANPGDYYLVIQKGQFRLARPVTIEEETELVAEDALTTLPSIHNPAIGDYVPRIALAPSGSDELEDILGKMGLGAVSDRGEYRVGEGSSAIDFYAHTNRTLSLPTAGTVADLVTNLDRLRQYHIIFFPCTGGSTELLQRTDVLRNMRDYVAEGGKLYVTDWAGDWNDNVFPAFIELESVDTPPEAYDYATDTWNTELFGTADGSVYDSDNAEAVDTNLHAWLDGQIGPQVNTGEETTFSASLFSAVANWNVILDTPAVQVGLDDEGLPLTESAHTYVIGGKDNALPKRPLTVSYEPTGCGRVLFTTYHTSPNTHVGLVPQERILLYLIMEIGVCIDEPVIF